MLTSKNINKETKIYIKQLNMSQRLRRNHDFLKLLAKCTPAQRKAILKVADNNLIKTICECVLNCNVLEKTAPTSRAVKKRLFPHKKALSTLVHKGTPIERKKKILIQHGGNFLGVPLPPVLRVLSSLLTYNESYQSYGSGPRIHFRKVAATTKNANPASNTNCKKLRC